MTAETPNEQTIPNGPANLAAPPARAVVPVGKSVKPAAGSSVAGSPSPATGATVGPALPRVPQSAIAVVKPTASRASAPVAAASAPTPVVPTAPVAAEPEAAVPAMAEATRASTADIPEILKETKDTTMSTTEEFIHHGQANVEAVMKSGQIWATGIQDLSRTFVESAQAQFDHSVATWKALAGTKSVKEAFDIQSSRARASLEKAVADTGRLTDASIKLAEQALAPITARLSVATEKFGAVEKFARPN